jgi:hypothetical protein
LVDCQDRVVPIQTIEMFLDLLGSGVVAMARFLVAADRWPVIVLAVGLVLLTVVIPLVSQSRRLHRMSHQLRELSNVVQRQEQTIWRLSLLLDNYHLAPTPPVFPFRDAEDPNPSRVQSANDPVDLQVQRKTLREAMFAQTDNGLRQVKSGEQKTPTRVTRAPASDEVKSGQRHE